MRTIYLVVLSSFFICLLACFGKNKAAYAVLCMGEHIFQGENVEGEGVELPAMHRAQKATKRKHFSPLVSKQVAARQQFRCGICRRLFDDQLWDLDHIIPLFRGGSNDLSNVRALCRACHMDVSARQRASL